MARRGRVEDHQVEARASGRWRGRGRVIEEVGEAVEGGDLRGAWPGQLLLHDRHDLGREELADGRQGPVGVLGRGLVGVDLHGPEVGHAPDGGDGMTDGLLEDVGQVGGRIGRHDEDAPAGVGLGHGGRAGHRRLADAALAGEEEELGHREIPSEVGKRSEAPMSAAGPGAPSRAWRSSVRLG